MRVSLVFNYASVYGILDICVFTWTANTSCRLKEADLCTVSRELVVDGAKSIGRAWPN